MRRQNDRPKQVFTRAPPRDPIILQRQVTSMTRFSNDTDRSDAASRDLRNARDGWGALKTIGRRNYRQGFAFQQLPPKTDDGHIR